MYKILNAEKLSANVFLMDVEAPRVAKHCLPGQFVIVKMDEVGERIPLTICDYDAEKGTVTIVFQPAGASTTRMAQLKAGDYFEDFVGPLGQPSELCHEDLEELKKKKIVFVAGGVGTAPVYLNALTGKGVHVVTVNDYLAKRDKEQMGKVYEFLGMTVGVIVHGQDPQTRRAQYQ